MSGGDEPLLHDRAWRRRNSRWLWPAVGGVGFLTWTSFLYIGVKAKRTSWLVAAALYFIAFVICFVLIGMAPELPDGSADTSSWQSNVGTLLALAVWFGGIVHALITNRQWLALQASPQDLANATWSPANDALVPGSLDDPWRSFVSQALTLQREIATTVANTPPGPMQERLQVVSGHVDAGLTECWQLAQGGQGLTRARARIDTAAVTRQIRDLPPVEANPSLTQVAQALQAQLDTATRIEADVASTYNGLLLLNARLGEVAARVIELSARPHALKDAAAVDTDVESVVDDLVAIRQALTEMDGHPTAT
jgi:hypothetical protein